MRLSPNIALQSGEYSQGKYITSDKLLDIGPIRIVEVRI